MVLLVGILTLSWHWAVGLLVLLAVIYFNAKRINAIRKWSLIVNQDQKLFIHNKDEMATAKLKSYWHLSRYLWLMIDSQNHPYYCLIKQSRVGGYRYARLLMALNQLNKQNESTHTEMIK